MNWPGIALLVPLLVHGQTITGKLVHHTLPLRSFRVGLLPIGADGITQSTQTDSNGTFRFPPLATGDYAVIAKVGGLIGQVRVVHVLSEKEADVGALELRDSSCDSPGVYCDYFFSPRPPRPPAPVVDLCAALKSPDRYGNTLVVMVGTLTALNGLQILTAKCDSALAAGDLTWTNAVLLPWQADSQDSPTLPDLPDLKKKLADLAAIIRKTTGSAASRVVAVYGFLEVPDGLQVIPCAGDFCTHPDIRMPPASFLSVEGFQELK